jgi:transglutaminase-like putative cysteine protease
VIPRSAFPLAVTLTSGLALASASRPLEFPTAVTAAFAVAALLRVLLGRDGRPLLGRLALGLVAATGLGLGSIFLLHALAGEGAPPLVGLLALCAAAQAILLFGPITPFTGFLLLLGSSLHVSGAAFLVKDAPAVGWTVATFVSMVWSLVLLERHASLTRADRVEGAVRRLRADPSLPPPRSAHLRTTGLVASVAAVAGTVLFVALPRVEGLPKLRFGGDDVPLRSDEPVAAAEEAGPRAPSFKTGLRDLYLRGNVVDTFSAGGWYPTVHEGPQTRWPADGTAAGWIEFEPSTATTGHGLRIAFLEGLTRRPEGWNLLFLPTETVRLRLRQRERYASYVMERADLKRFAPSKLLPGDHLEARVVEPAPSTKALLSARSDRLVAPSEVALQLPAELAGLRPIALSIVGAESNPWKRAGLLVEWLRRECRYTLRVPEMGNPATAVLTFVRDVRKGHCEYFASALALMLRSLGHPARVAFGFRGGDLQDEKTGGQVAIVRGVHAHLWTEMYFQGIGWVRLEPTPPDREATDAATVTQSGNLATVEEEPPFLERFFRFDGQRQRRFWSGVWNAISGAVAAAARFVFGPGALYVGWPVLALLLFLGVRRERRARRVREALGGGRALPPGAYGQALLLLAGRGLRRRRAQTAHEFVRAAAVGLPAGREPLARLTGLYEHERFGGRPAGAEDATAGAAALRDLRAALDDAK